MIKFPKLKDLLRQVVLAHRLFLNLHFRFRQRQEFAFVFTRTRFSFYKNNSVYTKSEAQIYPKIKNKLSKTEAQFQIQM